MSNSTIRVVQTNVLTVNVSSGQIRPGSDQPYTLRQDSGVIGGVNDIFELSPAGANDVLLFSAVEGKYINVPLSGAITINSSGVTLLSNIDCGTF